MGAPLVPGAHQHVVITKMLVLSAKQVNPHPESNFVISFHFIQEGERNENVRQRGYKKYNC